MPVYTEESPIIFSGTYTQESIFRIAAFVLWPDRGDQSPDLLWPTVARLSFQDCPAVCDINNTAFDGILIWWLRQKQHTKFFDQCTCCQRCFDFFPSRSNWMQFCLPATKWCIDCNFLHYCSSYSEYCTELSPFQLSTELLNMMLKMLPCSKSLSIDDGKNSK